MNKRDAYGPPKNSAMSGHPFIRFLLRPPQVQASSDSCTRLHGGLPCIFAPQGACYESPGQQAWVAEEATGGEALLGVAPDGMAPDGMAPDGMAPDGSSSLGTESTQSDHATSALVGCFLAAQTSELFRQGG